MVFERTREAINKYGAKGAAGFLGLLSLYDFAFGNYDRFAAEASLSAILYKTASFYRSDIEFRQINLDLRERDIEKREHDTAASEKRIQEQNERLNQRQLKHDIDDALAEKSEKLDSQLAIMRKVLSDDRDVLMLIRERKQYLKDEDDPEIVDLLARTDIDRYIGKKKPM